MSETVLLTCPYRISRRRYNHPRKRERPLLPPPEWASALMVPSKALRLAANRRSVHHGSRKALATNVNSKNLLRRLRFCADLIKYHLSQRIASLSAGNNIGPKHADSLPL
jgi:hypothetical protein